MSILTSPVIVIPSNRPESISTFKSKWSDHFRFHKAQVLIVWDSNDPHIELNNEDIGPISNLLDKEDIELVTTKTDAVRTAGFIFAAKNLQFNNLISFDDDVAPLENSDPIKDHLSILRKRFPSIWMNTLMNSPYVRGIPYSVRSEMEIHLSHGLWRGVPDFDGLTQKYLEPLAASDPVKYANPDFYVGPIPKNVLTSICGMSVAVTREALPYLYYAPQGPTTNSGYNRFADIWMGVNLLKEFWKKDWGVYSGASIIEHTRASNVYSNIAAENKGLEVNEIYYKTPDDLLPPYFADYTSKRLRFKNRITELLRSNPRPTPNI